MSIKVYEEGKPTIINGVQCRVISYIEITSATEMRVYPDPSDTAPYAEAVISLLEAEQMTTILRVKNKDQSLNIDCKYIKENGVNKGVIVTGDVREALEVLCEAAYISESTLERVIAAISESALKEVKAVVDHHADSTSSGKKAARTKTTFFARDRSATLLEKPESHDKEKSTQAEDEQPKQGSASSAT